MLLDLSTSGYQTQSVGLDQVHGLDPGGSEKAAQRSWNLWLTFCQRRSTWPFSCPRGVKGHTLCRLKVRGRAINPLFWVFKFRWKWRFYWHSMAGQEGGGVCYCELPNVLQHLHQRPAAQWGTACWPLLPPQWTSSAIAQPTVKHCALAAGSSYRAAVQWFIPTLTLTLISALILTLVLFLNLTPFLPNPNLNSKLFSFFSFFYK